MPAELLMSPRIPRAPKLPAFSLYPLKAAPRPVAPSPFVASSEPELPSWSALAQGLEMASTEGDEASTSMSAEDHVAPASRLDRARAYLNDPRGAANALGLGAAAGLIVASFMLFACK
jgi:hypothetical protein